MLKTKIYATIIGRLLLVGLLLFIRWAIFQPVYFVALILVTVCETFLNSASAFISSVKQLNDELFTKLK